jgi:hypothetical protein
MTKGWLERLITICIVIWISARTGYIFGFHAGAKHVVETMQKECVL